MDINDKKRKFVRVDDRFDVWLSKASSPEEDDEIRIDVGKTLNVSATGILVTVKTPVKLGTHIRIIFLRPYAYDYFEGMGEVVRIENTEDSFHNIGINFLGLTPSDSNKLSHYITQELENQK